MEKDFFQNSLHDIKSAKNIQNLTNSDLFDSLFLDDKNKALLDKLKQTYSDFYYISVSPNEIDKYKGNNIVYDILKQYHHTAENHNLELLILRYNNQVISQAKENIKKLQEQYGDIISENIANYSFVIGFFGGSAGRKGQEIIKKIKEHIAVKDLSI
ncbi:MAG: hypothetical protein M0P94_02655 [Candidatus Absconditabacterales bacterium]|nr:hypothetical protein [Candidatus Absconditabacterales bacterium]